MLIMITVACKTATSGIFFVGTPQWRLVLFPKTNLKANLYSLGLKTIIEIVPGHFDLPEGNLDSPRPDIRFLRRSHHAEKKTLPTKRDKSEGETQKEHDKRATNHTSGANETKGVNGT